MFVKDTGWTKSDFPIFHKILKFKKAISYFWNNITENFQNIQKLGFLNLISKCEFYFGKVKTFFRTSCIVFLNNWVWQTKMIIDINNWIWLMLTNEKIKICHSSWVFKNNFKFSPQFSNKIIKMLLKNTLVSKIHVKRG